MLKRDESWGGYLDFRPRHDELLRWSVILQRLRILALHFHSLYINHSNTYLLLYHTHEQKKKCLRVLLWFYFIYRQYFFSSKGDFAQDIGKQTRACTRCSF